MTVAKKKKVRKLKTIPKKKKFTGLLLGKAEPQKFTPKALFDALDVDGELPYWTIKPMTAKQRYSVQADESRCVSEGFLWLDKQGVSLKEAGELGEVGKDGNIKNGNLFLALNEAQKSFSDRELIDEITLSCIVNFNGGESVSAEDFEQYPEELKNALFGKIRELSFLNMRDVLGL